MPTHDLIEGLEAWLQKGGDPLEPEAHVVRDWCHSGKHYREVWHMPREGASGDVRIEITILDAEDL